MQKIRKFAAFTMLLCAIMVAGFTAGCGKTTLAPGGVYQGDTFLYQAEKTINTAHATFVEFLKWELQWRQVLPASVSRAADYVRVHEPDWIRSLNAAHDAYVNTPTPENKEKLTLALNIVKAGLSEAAFYMLQQKGVAPNNGLKDVKPLETPPVPR